MKLLADESVDGPIIQRLRHDGHEVTYIAEVSPGTADDEVLRIANTRGVVLLTSDADFGELAFRQKLAHSGVVLMRLDGLTNAVKSEVLSDLFARRGPELAGAFSVITPNQIRIRPPWQS